MANFFKFLLSLATGSQLHQLHSVRTRYILFALLCMGMLGMVSCVYETPPQVLLRTAEEQEIVLAEGDEIQAITQEGTLIVRAGKNDERSFEWDGTVRTAKMIRRPAPWYGHLGIYNPGPSGMWWKHDGVTRVIYDEYRLSFSSKEKAEEYILKWLGRKVSDYNSDKDIDPAGVWNDSGLVVWWKRSRWAEAMNVSVHQILINGEKPKELNGSQNNNLILKRKANGQ